MPNYRGDIGNTPANPTESQIRKDALRRRTMTVGQAIRGGRTAKRASSGNSAPSTPQPAVRRSRGRTSTTHGVPSRMHGWTIDPRSIKAFYDYAQDFRDNADQFKWAMDKIVMTYAYVALAGVQKRSLGPVDPMMKNMAAAWKVPVRRITGAYFLGWEVHHLALGVWALTNTSREAFYIEFGINHTLTGAVGPGGMRVRIRRPIMKLAVLEAVNIIEKTGILKEQVVSVVTPSLYQSPYITGSYRPKGKTGSAIGLVNLDALKAMVGSSGG